MLENFYRWLAEHPLKIISGTALLSVAALLLVFDIHELRPRLVVDASIERLLPAADADRAVLERLRTQFGDTDTVLVAVGFEQVFSRESFERIEELTRRYAALPQVGGVLSITNAQNPRADGEGLEVSSFSDQARADPVRLLEFPAEVAANPLYHQSLVSADGRVAAFVLSLSGLDEEEFRTGDFTGQLRGIATQVTGSSEVWITGSPVVKAATTNAILRTLAFTIPAVFVLMVLMLLVSFRSVRGMIAGTLTVALSLLWTSAAAVALDLPLNLVTAIAPPLIITLGLSYAVHLLAEFLGDPEASAPPATSVKTQLASGARRWLKRLWYGQGMESAPARTQRVLTHLAPGLFLSGATTVAGFLALMPGALPAIRQFAWMSIIGVTFSTLLTLCFLPAMLNLIGYSQNRRPLGEVWFARMARKLAAFDLKWRNWILGIALCSLPVDLYLASRIQTGTDFIAGFDEKTEVRRDFEAINSAFNGANTVSILIETYVEDALTDPLRAAEIERLQDWLRAQPEVGSATSYIDHLKLINQSLNEGRAAFARVPDEAQMIKQLLVFGGSDEIKRVIDARYSTALMSVRLKVDGSIAISDFVARTEQKLRALPPPLDAHITGSAVLATRTVNQIASGQVQSLLIASVAIWAMLALMFTSPRAALLAMLPNLIPVALYFAILGLFGISLSPTTSLIASIVLGIAVDDTIHFMARFNADARAKGNEKAAVTSALVSVLRPVTFTAIALCLGFLVFLGSELKNQAEFGLLASLTMALAWAADILITPALGSRMRIVTLWDLLRLDLGKHPQHTIPLFQGLSLRQTRMFALTSKMQTFEQNERVIREGDLARDMYVIVDGTVEAYIERGAERKTLATMSRGAVLGETGYFGQKRTANVEAKSAVRVLCFNAEDLERLRKRYPKIAAVIYRNLNRVQAERIARMTTMIQ